MTFLHGGVLIMHLLYCFSPLDLYFHIGVGKDDDRFFDMLFLLFLVDMNSRAYQNIYLDINETLEKAFSPHCNHFTSSCQRVLFYRVRKLFVQLLKSMEF